MAILEPGLKLVNHTELSVIIVNWNTRNLLAQCLRLVYDTITSLEFEVFVVDNASQDDSVAMVKRLFPQVRLLENEENVGFARANNQALQDSRGRYVLLLNTDTFVREGTIEQMVAFMDAHPDAGVAGCRLYYPNGKLQPSCSSFPSLSTEFYLLTSLDRLLARSPIFGRYWMTCRDFNSVREVDVVMGAFMIVRRQAIEKAGLLDETFFMYSEEVDWCYRIRRNGWKIYYVPHAEATHIWGGSVQHNEAEMVVEMYKSRTAFFRKHYGSLSAWLLKLLLVGASASRLVLLPFKYVLRGEAREKTRQKWAAYWKLLKALPSL
jgi:GT2 family glycosyltransferase